MPAGIADGTRDLARGSDATGRRKEGGRRIANTLQAHEAESFKAEVSSEEPAFFIKGAESLDWGMKNRLARIFNPKSRKTVMLVWWTWAASTEYRFWLSRQPTKE
jgi:hypothetical protein